MAKTATASGEVHQLLIEPVLTARRDRHRCEGFVDLPQCDVGRLQSGPLQHLPDHFHGTEPRIPAAYKIPGCSRYCCVAQVDHHGFVPWSALLAGATLVTKEIPKPETTLRLLERERVTLFRGWPDQAEALRRQSAFCRSRLVGVARRQPGGAVAARTTARTRCAGEVVRDDRSFRALLRLSADTDMPRSAWGSCGKPFEGMEVRIVNPDTGDLCQSGPWA